MRKIINFTAIVSAILAPTLAQAQATSPMEVSATVIPGCFIEADNINFGNLITPITNQSATSNMRVHCSKNTNLTISIGYNGEVSGGTNAGYSYKQRDQGKYSFNIYEIYNDNVKVGEIHCSSNYTHSYDNTEGGIMIRDLRLSSTPVVNTNICKGNNLVASTNLISPYNSSVKIGALKGIVSSEEIKYSLELPNNANTIWNDTNKYQMVANGQSQTVSMKANITSAGNPTYRMTPDNYKDTLTVILTY